MKWPWSATTLRVKAVVTREPAQGLLFVTFRDDDGNELDGSIGLDRLARRFSHRGQTVKMPTETRRLLALLAEHGGGRWIPRSGFAIREEDAPDALRAFRALPETAAPEESSDVRQIEIDARPLEAAEFAEITGDEKLEKSTAFVDQAGETRVEPDVVRGQSTRAWIPTPRGFVRRPLLTRAEIGDVASAATTNVLEGDDVPYYLAKQLLEARRAGRKVILGPRALQAEVQTGAWMPTMAVDLQSETLQLDVAFKAGNANVSWEDATAAGNRRFVQLGRDRWVANDHETRRRVERMLDEITDLKRTTTSGRFEAPARYLPQLNEDFASIGTLELSESAKAFRDTLLNFERIEHVAAPRALSAQLRPYQQHGLNWLAFLRKYGLAGILADDMGLGKTVQTLSAILAAHEAGQTDPSLVVCPASVVNVWNQEISKFCTGVTPHILTSRTRDRFLESFPARSIAIASYAAVERNADAMNARVWNYFVLDEAHRVKNHNTSTAKACKSILARHKIAVTGTPIQNRLRDLFALYDSIMPGHLGADLKTFEHHFGKPIEKERNEAAAARLRKRIDPFKLRRLKSEVAKDLPELHIEMRKVKLLGPQRELYRQFVNNTIPDSLGRLRGTSRGSPLEVLEQLLRLRQICAHPRLVDPSIALYETSAKFEELRELLEEALEAGHKALVFTQWSSMASLISEHLHTEKIAHAIIDGSVSIPDRAEIVRTFQRKDGPPVLVVSLLAGGEGITLTEADTVIMYDRWWNPAIEAQAIARAHRLGQERAVSAYILESEDTIEERLAAMLGEKKELASDLIHIDGLEKRITRDDLLAVLQEELQAAQNLQSDCVRAKSS